MSEDFIGQIRQKRCFGRRKEEKMKTISLLGSTGSIGTQTLDVIRRNKDIKVAALAAGTRVKELAAQAREFKPELVCIGSEKLAGDLKTELADMDVRIVSGSEGLIEAATIASADIVLTAVVGMMGIVPTIRAIEAGKDIALANKETLVAGGKLVMQLAKEKGVRLTPIDSEHSAIFQCLQGNLAQAVERLIITASGGPFYGRTREQLKGIKKEQALRHPNWSMGAKITIDSSTLMNKGLEFIEAMWLFSMPPERISILVHPQSIIHSMVEFVDGAVMAQLGTPDMKLPIQYALYYPHRRYLPGERLDFKTLTEITFEEPDMETFLGLPMAMEASRRGGSMPTVFNAANERAVAKFLHGQIGFLDIYRSIREAMDRHQVIEHPCLEEILETEAKTYEWMESRWSV